MTALARNTTEELLKTAVMLDATHWLTPPITAGEGNEASTSCTSRIPNSSYAK